MGTAFAVPLADNGVTVHLVGTHLDVSEIESIRRDRTHPRLSGVLPDTVRPFDHTQLTSAMTPAPDLVVIGVSSPGIPWVLEVLSEHLSAPVPLLLLTKGLAVTDGLIVTIPMLVADELSRTWVCAPTSVAAGGIGGPCIAGELFMRKRSHVVMGIPDSLADLATAARSSYYRIETTRDVNGVELCAAFKNLLTIGVSAARGRDNQNGEADAFALAAAELEYLVSSLGGRAETARGLAGVGDLYVTCQAGRNRNFGSLLGQDLRYTEARARMAGETIEGADLARKIGAMLRALMRAGTLDATRLTLTNAVLDAVLDDRPFQLP